MQEKRREGRPQPTDRQTHEINQSVERQSYWIQLRRLCLKASMLTRGKSQRTFTRLANFLWSQLE